MDLVSTGWRVLSWTELERMEGSFRPRGRKGKGEAATL